MSGSNGNSDEEKSYLPVFGMTATRWRASRDARELIRYAAKRIPPMYLRLVALELAQTTWRYWHAEKPDDWRFAALMTAGRAFCLGDATEDEMRDARFETRRLAQSTGARTEAASRAMAAAFALGTAAELCVARPGRDDLVSLAVEACVWVAKAHGAPTDVDGPEERASLEREYDLLAERVRRLIPYTAEASERWELDAPLVLAGNGVLHLDGWFVTQPLGSSGLPKTWSLAFN